jgi:hypothetical protein
MAIFNCSNCYFKFKPKTERKDAPEICPNCGKRGCMTREQNMDTMIRNI